MTEEQLKDQESTQVASEEKAEKKDTVVPYDPTKNRPQNQQNKRGGSFGGRSGGARRGGFGNRDRNARPGSKDRRSSRDRKSTSEQELDVESKVIDVRRVTRVAKGGKKMRFSALVVVGDKKGQVGFGIKKGLDFQDAVAKATKKARENMIKIELDKNHSLPFTLDSKFKAVQVMLKPARSGTGLIAGGFVRPVLELAGVENAYSKIHRSRNKFSGVQAVVKALESYKK
jgi:small subunit ribosomal protein S5